LLRHHGRGRGIGSGAGAPFIAAPLADAGPPSSSGSGPPSAARVVFISYEVAETTLEPGETVILYTDGVTDAMNAANDRFGEPRMRQSLTAAGPGATAAGDAIVKAVQKFVAERQQFDDITLVCLARC
jgi:phosphoserine phosphatase RsbU/P